MVQKLWLIKIPNKEAIYYVVKLDSSVRWLLYNPRVSGGCCTTQHTFTSLERCHKTTYAYFATKIKNVIML